MRGRGVPHVRGRGRGDLRVRVFVDVPDELEEQEQLLREFAALREDVAEPGQGLLGRIKSPSPEALMTGVLERSARPPCLGRVGRGSRRR